MTEPKPSPTGGELESHRGGGIDRLVRLDAAPPSPTPRQARTRRRRCYWGEVGGTGEDTAPPQPRPPT